MPGEQKRFQDMLGPSVQALGCELLGVQVARGRKHTVLRLYIDRPEGITLEDCERVSHQVSGILDVEDPIDGEYSLEVSSPGADRPLFDAEHFARFAGHLARIRMGVPVDGRRSVTGVLEGMDGEDVVVREGDAVWRLPLEQIAQARLVPPA
jgi:ribosome maturation factor RimP